MASSGGGWPWWNGSWTMHQRRSGSSMSWDILQSKPTKIWKISCIAPRMYIYKCKIGPAMLFCNILNPWSIVWMSMDFQLMCVRAVLHPTQEGWHLAPTPPCWQNYLFKTIYSLKLTLSPWKWAKYPWNKKDHMGVSKNNGTPKWMVKIKENPIKMDDLGVPPIFGNTHIYLSPPIFRGKLAVRFGLLFDVQSPPRAVQPTNTTPETWMVPMVLRAPVPPGNPTGRYHENLRVLGCPWKLVTS